MPRKASPLSSSSIGNFTWSYIFIRHMICVLLGASCIILVFAFQFTTIIRCIHLLGEAYLIRIYQNLLCASLISFELDSFCSSASLISFRAWWCLNFGEIASLSCFTYIILRVFQNSMVFAMVIKLVLEWQASKLGIIKTIIGSELDAMINLMLDNCFEIQRW